MVPCLRKPRDHARPADGGKDEFIRRGACCAGFLAEDLRRDHPDAKHQAPDTNRPTPDARRPAPDVQHPKSGARRPRRKDNLTSSCLDPTMDVMTTTTSRLDRVFEWFLDRDSDSFGDEQERLRYYEGTAVASTIQGIAVPWAMAVALWIGGRPVAPALLAVTLAFYLPLVLASAYVKRRRVRVQISNWSRRYKVLTALTLLPYLLVCAELVRLMLDAEGQLGAVVGGIIGAALAGVVLVIQGRRQRASELSLKDED
jgi:hypothetical protein